MGLLSLGTPLEWKDIKKYTEHVRTHGILQLLAVYDRHKDRKRDRLLWGDEIEYMVVEIDEENKSTRLTLRQDEILDALIKADKEGALLAEGVTYHQEFGRYMIEATPAEPYTGEFEDLLKVEDNMYVRRRIAKKHMKDDEHPLTITAYPLLGVGKFASPWIDPDGPVSRSLFLPDNIINTHPRFPYLAANIRERRGEKVAINIPIFKDKQTPWPFHDPRIPWDRDLYPEDANARDGSAQDNHIYMDAMGFGMGSCCVQLTFQATDIIEARQLYDQLTPITPLMLAISAAAPLFRGYVSDQDVRWNVISASVDDRTRVERGLDPVPENWAETTTTPYNTSPRLSKSRYDSVSCYIGNGEVFSKNEKLYNDLELTVNTKVQEMLKDKMDAPLVKHFSYLFTRDPLVIFEELLDQDDSTSTDHFENIQSTNWQTMRFKPPPNDHTGWRVEFRSMDVQITDFENAALSVFVVLLTRVILSYKLCFYIPISKVDENMKRAHSRDAISREKFWFRTNVENQTANSDPEFKELTLNEIFNGCPDFIGLIPLMKRYLVSMNVDMATLCALDDYLDIISKRASGELWTAAKWIRQFVTEHPDYKHDSVVPPTVNFELTETLKKLTEGEGWNTTAKAMYGKIKPRVESKV